MLQQFITNLITKSIQKRMKTHSLYPSKLAPIREVSLFEFNVWMEEFNVSMLYSEKEAEETRKRLPFLIKEHIPTALERLKNGK